MLIALQTRLWREICAEEPIVHFMPEYAAYLLNRREIEKDGKTAYERSKGKRATVLRIEFGEKLFNNVKTQTKRRRLTLGGNIA